VNPVGLSNSGHKRLCCML